MAACRAAAFSEDCRSIVSVAGDSTRRNLGVEIAAAAGSGSVPCVASAGTGAALVPS